MATFVWGKNGEKLTPEDVERQRLASAMMYKQGADFSPAGHWSEALGRAFNGWASGRINKIADQGEKEGLARADERIAAALAGQGGGFGGGGGRSAGNAPQFTPDPGAALSADVMSALGKPTPATPEAIRAGLVRRGLPEHVADGFVMNMRDESGLNPGINEASPVVPGSRGGFGLYQLTGPRREAYEAYASQNGLPLDSVDGQLDFLMSELQGPESRAAEAILGARDAGSAGAAIVNEFLRPSPEHAAKRASEYLGGPPTYDTAGGAPAIPGGSGGMDIASLLALQSDPWVAKKYGGVVDALMGQQFSRQNALWEQQQKMADPMYQAQLAELTAPKPVDPFAGTKEIGGVLYGPDGQGGFVPLITPPVDPGYAVMGPEDVAALGLPPGSYQRGPKGEIKQIGGGGTNVTVNNGGVGVEPLGTEGQILVPDPAQPSGYRVEVAPGSKLAIEADAAAKKAELTDSSAMTATEVVTSAAARAREANNERAVGGLLGGIVAYNPSSSNAEVYRQVDVLKSNAKIENLTAMRAASPTGGALGSVTDKESEMLAAKSGALDPASPNFERDLDDYERTLLRVVHGKEAGDAIFEASREESGGAGGISTDADGWTVLPNGVKVRVKP
ncbi:MAG: phage tail tip lysozyme [Candidatus Pacebacteria bacterium]|nr:phage tail tip lysozyme [Candidatus Paceibacterota bacterium]